VGQPLIRRVAKSLAGGALFEAVLNFRVAHLSRRVTGGVFDFRSFAGSCISLSSQALDCYRAVLRKGKGLVFPLCVHNSVDGDSPDQFLVELTDPVGRVARALKLNLGCPVLDNPQGRGI
jgi:hypothetical protein